MLSDEDKYRANFLWPHEKGSVEEAGYELANGISEGYIEEWWNTLLERVLAQLEADRERDAQIVSDYSKERGRFIKKIARWRKALEKIQKDAADPWCINIARETLEGDDDGGS